MSQHDTLTLEHCPFCGKSHTPKIVLASEHWADEYDGYYPHSESYAVMCDASSPNGPGGCGASGGFKETEADAIAAWNRRAALSATQPAQAQQAGEVVTLGALAKRNVFDAIREAYDLGYNDARNARAVPGDSAPGYAGRDVESDHGGALFNTLNRRLANTTPPAPAQPVQGVPDEWRSALTQCVQALEFAHHKSGVVQGMPCVSEAIVSGTALLTSSATPPAQPAVAQGAGEVVAELKRLASVCPELNLNNYGPDDVDELNAWAVEVAQAIDQLADTAQPAPVVPDGWQELCRRLYVELWHCDKQMTSTLNDDDEPVWTTGPEVRDVLRDAKSALEGATPTPPAQAAQQGEKA